MRRYPTLGKGRISEALHVEHTMIQKQIVSARRARRGAGCDSQAFIQ
jgi:hypothetical protein